MGIQERAVRGLWGTRAELGNGFQGSILEVFLPDQELQ